jgi:hypothetical protein
MSRNPQFADWYRSAGVAPPEGLLDSRWAGVEQLAGDLTVSLVLAIAKLFVLPRPTEALVPIGFREAFREHDDTFASQGNLYELKVLAGAVLRNTIDQNSELSLTAALTVACGAFGTREGVLSDPQIVNAAERFLVDCSRRTRVGTSSSKIAFSQGPLQDQLPASLFAPNQTPNLREPLVAILAQLGSQTSAIGEIIQAINRRQQVLSEDLEILWWLQTRFSRELKRSFQEVGFEVGSLLFPSELADLTAFVPGSEGITAVLARALKLAGAQSSTRCELATSINVTPREWREKCARLPAVAAVGVLSPVLMAIQKSLETDGLDDWQPIYRKACDIPLDQSFSLLKVSVQVYRECMLLRNAAETES